MDVHFGPFCKDPSAFIQLFGAKALNFCYLKTWLRRCKTCVTDKHFQSGNICNNTFFTKVICGQKSDFFAATFKFTVLLLETNHCNVWSWTGRKSLKWKGHDVVANVAASKQTHSGQYTLSFLECAIRVNDQNQKGHKFLEDPLQTFWSKLWRGSSLKISW